MSLIIKRRILPKRVTKIIVNLINSLLSNISPAIKTFLSKVLITLIINTRIPTVGATHMLIKLLLIITCYFSTSNIRQLSHKSSQRKDQDLKSHNMISPLNNNIKILITRSRCIINKICSHSNQSITDNTREANPRCTHPSSLNLRMHSSMRQRDGGNDSILINYCQFVL